MDAFKRFGSDIPAVGALTWHRLNEQAEMERTSRPQLDRLIQEFRAGSIERLVVSKIDRLAG
jgi:DNA invertase Pin-like site-specific DNA recombinase